MRAFADFVAAASSEQKNIRNTSKGRNM